MGGGGRPSISGEIEARSLPRCSHPPRHAIVAHSYCVCMYVCNDGGVKRAAMYVWRKHLPDAGDTVCVCVFATLSIVPYVYRCRVDPKGMY